MKRFIFYFALLTLHFALSSICLGERQRPDNPTASTPQDVELGPLPWQRQRVGGEKPTQAISGVRELLDLYGIDASHLANLVDGEPLDAFGEETLLRILFRLPRIPRASLENWRNPNAAWEELAERPAEHRAEVFKLTGRAKRVDRVSLLPEMADRLEFDHYFRVDVTLDESPCLAVVCTREVPQCWAVNEPLDEPVGALALFLKVAAGDNGQSQLVFAANRLGWYPDRVDLARWITPDLVFLASYGMDVALFDGVRARNRQPLGSQDREGFYRLLSTVQRIPADALQARAQRSVDLAQLLNEPDAHHGELATVRGTLRRVTRIAVAEEDLRQRFGLDHYYHLDVLMPLGDQIIRLGEPREGEQVPTFRNNFPVVVCTLSLPAGLDEGNDVREEVRVPAVFFKLWAFRSEYVSAIDDGLLQPSPMFMAQSPGRVDPPPPAGRFIGWIACGAFLAAVVFIWYSAAKWRRGDEQFRRAVLRRQRDRSVEGFHHGGTEDTESRR